MEEISLIIRRAKRGGQIKLSLSNKQLTEIPSEIFQLGFLQELDLSYNKLTSINPSISQLFMLKKLNLAYNNIDKIPKEIQNMELEELVLDGNPCESGSQSTQYNNSGINQQQYQQSQSQVKDIRKQYTMQGNQPPLYQQQPRQNQLSKTYTVEQDPQQQAAQIKLQQLEQHLQLLQSILNKKQYPSLDINLQDINLLEQISQGGFSTVHRAEWRSTEVVVKKIFDPVVTQELLADLENEVTMMNYLRHPNTLLLIGASTQPPDLFIVTEFCQNKSLFEALHTEKKNLKYEKKMKILFEIATSINFYHECGVVHRDLKSHNVLLDANYGVRICDFGLTKFKSELNTGTMQFSGTPAYMAPEIFQKRAYDNTVDVFAFGTLIWEVMTGEVPYDGLDPLDIKNRVSVGEHLSSTKYPNLDKLILKCRAVDPRERPSFNEILKHLSS